MAIVMSVPALLFLNAWQAFQYEMAENEVAKLEELQRDWLESNKKLLVGIEVLSAPERIESLAASDAEVEKVANRNGIHLRIENSNGGNGG